MTVPSTNGANPGRNLGRGSERGSEIKNSTRFSTPAGKTTTRGKKSSKLYKARLGCFPVLTTQKGFQWKHILKFSRKLAKNPQNLNKLLCWTLKWAQYFFVLELFFSSRTKAAPNWANYTNFVEVHLDFPFFRQKGKIKASTAKCFWCKKLIPYKHNSVEICHGIFI